MSPIPHQDKYVNNYDITKIDKFIVQGITQNFHFITFTFFVLFFLFRNLPRANIIGVLLVTVVYLLTNISYLAVLGTDGLLASEAVAVVRSSFHNTSTFNKYFLHKRILIVSIKYIYHLVKCPFGGC